MEQEQQWEYYAPTPAGRAYIESIPDPQLECMSQHHQWPLIKLGRKKFPKGISAVPQQDGCFQIRETCTNCGKVRWFTTVKGGFFDTSAIVVYRYDDPDGWVKRPRNEILDVTRRDLTAELFSRLLQEGPLSGR